MRAIVIHSDLIIRVAGRVGVVHDQRLLHEVGALGMTRTRRGQQRTTHVEENVIPALTAARIQASKARTRACARAIEQESKRTNDRRDTDKTQSEKQ